MGLGEQYWKIIFAMIFVNFGFAAVNVLFKKVIDGGANHMVIVTYRFVISGFFLAPIAYYLERSSRCKLTFSVLCYLFLGALVGYRLPNSMFSKSKWPLWVFILTLTQWLFLLGLGYTSSTFSCAFLNAVPVNTFLLALPFGLEKVDLKKKAGAAKVMGAVICIVGTVILCVYRGVSLTKDIKSSYNDNVTVSDEKTKNWVVGSLFLMAACLMFSSWFLVQAKIGKVYPCKYSSTAIFNLFGAIQSALVSLISERDVGMWVLKGNLEILTVVFSGVVGSGLCYVTMSWCVKQKGPVFTSAFTPFTQIFAAFFDVFLLHDQIYLGSVIGSVLVIIGLYILLWGKSKEAEESHVKQNGVGDGDVEIQVPVATNSTT